MSTKTENAYAAVFRYLNDNVMDLKCSMFMTDYERALRNGLASVIPDAKITSCWFHFCQAVKRNVRKLSTLMNLIKSNEDARKIYYELLCLPLLPFDKIQSAFDTIKTRALIMNSVLFTPFLNNYQNQWLIRVRIHICNFFSVILCFSSHTKYKHAFNLNVEI